MQPTIKLKWYINDDMGTLDLVCNGATVSFIEHHQYGYNRPEHADYRTGVYKMVYDHYDKDETALALSDTEDEVRKWLASMGILTAALEFDRDDVIRN